MMMEAARTSETLVNFYQTALRYNPVDSHLRTHRRENLKSYLLTRPAFWYQVTSFHHTGWQKVCRIKHIGGPMKTTFLLTAKKIIHRYAAQKRKAECWAFITQQAIHRVTRPTRNAPEFVYEDGTHTATHHSWCCIGGQTHWLKHRLFVVRLNNLPT
jgi:hypothetical protein